MIQCLKTGCVSSGGDRQFIQDGIQTINYHSEEYTPSLGVKETYSKTTLR